MTRVYVGFGEAPPPEFDISLQLGEHIYTGTADFDRKFGSPTTLEHDLLNLAATVFAVDRGLPRGPREEFARRIELSLPITNVARLQPLVPDIERVLRRLSDDSWRLNLRQQNGVPELTFVTPPRTEGTTLLFSGGLDSLAAAVEFGKNSALHLVSHVTRNQQTRSTQQELVSIMSQSELSLPHDQFFMSSRDAQNFDHDVESTQRTRSFLFMILGGLVARRLGHNKVLMIAENGQLAIHLPLNHARVGAFSTHTAHPDVMEEQAGSVERLFVEANYLAGGPGIPRLREMWEKDYAKVCSVRSGSLPVPGSFSELLPGIGECCRRIDEGPKPVLIVNGNNRDEAPNFEKTPVWKILVGGTKLSRGYTVEGLTVSYYRRLAGAADTLMQMGRGLVIDLDTGILCDFTSAAAKPSARI